MSRKAKNLADSNKHWCHKALSFLCMSMLIFSFCIVGNASTEVASNSESVANGTSAESRQSETGTQANQSNASSQATDSGVSTKALDDNRETRATASASSNRIADAPSVSGTWKREAGGWRFYSNSGVMQKGFCYISGKKYYFGPSDGLMKTGWQKVGRYYYYLGSADDGSVKTGWQNIGGSWYYFQINGVMSYGMVDVGSSVYYFGSSSDGAMKTGWQVIYDLYYYFGGANDGAMKTGWQQIGGSWYYFENDHVLVSDTVKQIAGSTYVFNADGVMMTKSFYFKGKKYLTDASGAVIGEGSNANVIEYGKKFLGENGNRFNDWYYNGNTAYRTWSWCNTFVSYVMYQCGVNFKKNAYVPYSEEWMHNNYKWVDFKDAKAGDVIVFCWTGEGNNSGRGNRDHIGFLISRNADGTFTTLEGNTNNGVVAIRTRYAKNIRNIFSPI